MSTDRVLSLIDEFMDCFVTRIHFFGGEPLLRKDFFEIVSYCNRRGVPVGFNSNGQLITREVGQRLSECEFESISISLDGPTEETNDRIRGSGTFEKAVQAVECLAAELRRRGRRTILNVAATISGFNYVDAARLIRLACQLGASSVTYATMRLKGRAALHQSLFRIGNQELYTALRAIASEAAGVGSALRVVVPVPPRVRDFLRGLHAVELASNHETYCIGGLGEVRITSDGLVYPCIDGEEAFTELVESAPEKTPGANNLTLRSFRECFFGASFQDFCRMAHEHVNDRMPAICQTCDYRNKGECWPICGARSLEDTSKLYQLCEYVETCGDT
jgi:MoaA/NifB/PqqE/SkfB family radical SAM enzyme